MTEDGKNVTPEDILVFFTGADCEPPLGFSRSPRLTFGDGKLITASTCALRLTLPVLSSYEEFKGNMILSLKGNDGFGKA